MFDVATCSAMSLAPSPVPSVEALVDLKCLLAFVRGRALVQRGGAGRDFPFPQDFS
jgi:hypothetical protein